MVMPSVLHQITGRGRVPGPSGCGPGTGGGRPSTPGGPGLGWKDGRRVGRASGQLMEYTGRHGGEKEVRMTRALVVNQPLR